MFLNLIFNQGILQIITYFALQKDETLNKAEQILTTWTRKLS